MVAGSSGSSFPAYHSSEFFFYAWWGPAVYIPPRYIDQYLGGLRMVGISLPTRYGLDESA